MKKYETPDISIERYGISSGIMEGDIDGDLWTQPSAWEDLFGDKASQGGVEGNILD